MAKKKEKKSDNVFELGRRKISEFATIEELWMALTTYAVERDKAIRGL
jgi:hypothetical protein